MLRPGRAQKHFQKQLAREVAPLANAGITTMEEFAAISGISRPTLSKYFNDPHSVRATTRQRIESALEQHDYRPNIYAMNQNRRLTRNIGVLVPCLEDPIHARLAGAIEDICASEGYRPVLMSARGSTRQEVANLETLAAMRPAGALFAPLGANTDRQAAERFCQAIPTVLFDANLAGLGAGFVGSDNHDLVAQSIHHLCATGSAPCFFETRRASNHNALQRRDAYLRIMQAQGYEPQLVQIEGRGHEIEKIARLGAHSILEAGGFPSDTVLCSNDRLAVGLLSACYEKGVAIGRGTQASLRVASLDNYPISEFTCPTLTTVAQDLSTVARRSCDALFDLISDRRPPAKRAEHFVPGILVRRVSA